MRVLFDTNVILDVLLARAPHAAPAIELLDHVARKELDAILGATSVTTIYYLAEKAAGKAQARRHVSDLLDLFDGQGLPAAEVEDHSILSRRTACASGKAPPSRWRLC